MTALALAGLAGCSTARPGPLPMDAQLNPAGTRVLPATPAVQRQVRQSRQVPPWWASRSDHPRAYTLGRESPQLLRAYTRTIDRRRTSHGRVFDHFRSTTYRERVQRAVQY
ncbi:MAG: hypothetical protein ACLFV3_02090 [Phycisphaeraceae bacterium]